MKNLKTGYYKDSLPLKDNPLILEPEDMTKDKWKFVCRLFTGTNYNKTQRIVISQKGVEYFISNEEIKYKKETQKK